MNLQKRIRTAISARQITGTLRMRTIIEKIENNTRPFLIHKEKRYCNFSSNDYLGLSRHPAVIRAWKDGAERFGVGSGSSSYISGYTVAHWQLEETLAQWLEYPRALLFISGFAANQAVITTLMSKDDRIIADRLSHASILEASNLSLAQLHRFIHNNTTHLHTLLNNNICDGQKLVITEGIFSMDGDHAPLATIHDITKKNNAWLMVDDAHGIGITGYEGRGSCDIQGIKPELLIITFGKGIGVSGAAVLCNDEVAQYLIQFANHLIYSTSMPPAQAMALRAAIDIIRSDEGDYLRYCLIQNIHIFHEGINNLQLNKKFIKSNSAIQPLIIGDNAQALYVANCLKDAGFWVIAIRPPTVPNGTARLRLTLTATHKPHDIMMLLEALHDINSK